MLQPLALLILTNSFTKLSRGVRGVKDAQENEAQGTTSLADDSGSLAVDQLCTLQSHTEHVMEASHVIRTTCFQKPSNAGSLPSPHPKKQLDS